MKKMLLTLSILGLLMTGCQKNSTDNNKELEYDELEVNFRGIAANMEWSKDAKAGIFSSCTLNANEATSMSVNKNAQYAILEEGNSSLLKKVGDNDAIIASYGAHNLDFAAYYPYDSSATDRTAIAAKVPQTQIYGTNTMDNSFFVTTKSVTSVVATIDLEFENIFSVIEFIIPADVIDEELGTTIKSLTFKPTDEQEFAGSLAISGKYNIATGLFTESASGSSKQVVVDFGQNGLALTAASTKISVAVAPFTVPEGGMSVVISDMLANNYTIKILDKSEDVGTVIAAGDIFTQYLSSGSDGIIPVVFPVIFPLGYANSAYQFSLITQPRWISEGVWVCPDQLQAYGQWNKVSDPSEQYKQTTEYVNSASLIGSPGIKGIWTGDYMEFTLPVKNFAAGTSLTIKFPLYTRQGPVFWDIKYLDGAEWKCNKSVITCYDPLYSMNATFFLVRGGKVIEHTMTFDNAIKSGEIKIRVECADGRVQASEDTKVIEREAPYASSSYAAPFYFYLVDSDVTSISFKTN